MSLDGTPLLDLAVLDELRDSTGGDEAFIVELVETYISEGAANLDGMIAAAAAGDPAAIVRPAHTLKSSSASLGAMRLSAICRGIEEAGREARSDGLIDDVELARVTWQQTLEAFAASGFGQ
jgi:HPt (histidine-containing phosphotransfer) domain-containing protein